MKDLNIYNIINELELSEKMIDEEKGEEAAKKIIVNYFKKITGENVPTQAVDWIYDQIKHMLKFPMNQRNLEKEIRVYCADTVSEMLKNLGR